MTVAELRKALKGLSGEMEVVLEDGTPAEFDAVISPHISSNSNSSAWTQRNYTAFVVREEE